VGSYENSAQGTSYLSLHPWSPGFDLKKERVDKEGNSKTAKRQETNE